MRQSFIADVELAKKIGLIEAGLLQFFTNWIRVNKRSEINYHDGTYWIWMAVPKIQREMPFISKATVERAIAKLKKLKLLRSELRQNHSRYMCNWYTVNIDELLKICPEIIGPSDILREPPPQNEVVPPPQIEGAPPPQNEATKISNTNNGEYENVFSSAGAERPKKKSSSKPKEKTLGSRIWDAYSEAFKAIYKRTPLRNAKTNALCTQLGKRVGEYGPDMIRFYLRHRDSWYVKNLHSLDYAVKDAEKLYIEWQAGQQMTGHRARKVEQHAEVDAAVSRFLEKRRNQ